MSRYFWRKTDNIVLSSKQYIKTPTLTVNESVSLGDGVTAPDTVAGYAQLYVDTADGDLKVKFGDGTIKTIVTDTASKSNLLLQR